MHGWQRCHPLVRRLLVEWLIALLVARLPKLHTLLHCSNQRRWKKRKNQPKRLFYFPVDSIAFVSIDLSRRSNESSSKQIHFHLTATAFGWAENREFCGMRNYCMSWAFFQEMNFFGGTKWVDVVVVVELPFSSFSSSLSTCSKELPESLRMFSQIHFWPDGSLPEWWRTSGVRWLSSNFTMSVSSTINNSNCIKRL